ncbi:hypothetical protein BLGI_220 [Brevibacillus laterosporus GI-9]|nr:hypothetical protein BLGI_220 [Brevibacillus laterosporus GI-9]
MLKEAIDLFNRRFESFLYSFLYSIKKYEHFGCYFTSIFS